MIIVVAPPCAWLNKGGGAIALVLIVAITGPLGGGVTLLYVAPWLTVLEALPNAGVCTLSVTVKSDRADTGICEEISLARGETRSG